MVSAFIRGPLWLGVIFAIAFTGCNPKPKTNKDQVSYTIGAQFGKSLKSQGLDIDPKILARGFAHAYGGGGKDMKLTEEEMQAAMMKLSEEKQKEMKIEAEKNKVKADEFLAENKVKADIKTTSSGLQYKHVTEGSGPSPKPDDVVVVHYKGTLIDGTEFDSSHKRNQPAEFPVKGVIPGWTEGLQLMKKGGKSMFYIAPELAYGDRARQQIAANSVLVFEVELIDVKPPKKK